MAANSPASVGFVATYAPYMSMCGFAFSVGSGIYNMVHGDQEMAEINRKLDEILENEKAIKARLEAVFDEVQWTQIVGEAGKAFEKIDYWFGFLAGLRQRLKAANNNWESLKPDIKKWSDTVSDDNNGVPERLFVINRAIMGTELTPPLMEVVANRVRHKGNPTQALYYSAVTAFEKWLLIQQKALICLANAYKYLHPDAETNEILAYLEPYAKTKVGSANVSLLKVQSDYSQQFIDSGDASNTLDKYYHSQMSGNTEGENYLGCSENLGNVDTSQVVADPGQAVVGYKLYWKKFTDKTGSIGIKILQAPFNNGGVEPGATPSTKENTSFSSDQIRIFKDPDPPNIADDKHLHMHRPELPPGEVATGMMLSRKHNRVAIQLQAARLDKDGNIDENSKYWVDAPGWGTTDPDDYVVIRGAAKFFDINTVTPTPLMPITGAGFALAGDDHRLRITILLKTGLARIEDLWKKYDVATAIENEFQMLSIPEAPDFNPGQWVKDEGYGTSGRWNPGYKVRYAVAFYGPQGTRLGPWWQPTHWPGAGPGGYYAGSPWACPQLTNISVDLLGKATGRIIYRQFQGSDPEAAAVIANNVDTTFQDMADTPGFGPPASAPDFDPGNWKAGVPVDGSSNWIKGYKVRYAVSFYGPNGETPMSPWWHPTHWPGADVDGYYGGDPWAHPTLTNIPTDPTGTATGRKIYRQFLGGRVELVGDIPNNTDTRFLDARP
jgi:hypothetical protein